jgi:hypothetical protein
MKKSKRIFKITAEYYTETLEMQAGKINYRIYSSISEMAKDLDSMVSSDFGIKKIKPLLAF